MYEKVSRSLVYLARLSSTLSEKEYEEFIVIRVNLNIIKEDNEEYLYNEDDPYLEPNNIRYNGII